MDGPRLVLDGGDDRLHVGGGERVDEVHADRRDDLIRTEVDREQTARPLDPGCARSIAQIDETTSESAGSPMRSPLLSRARDMATTPSRSPMAMDATPSSTGRRNAWRAAIPARAIMMPIS